MNVELVRELLLSLPHVVEWTQWGDLIYSVGDKAIGGKMFAMVNADRASELVISFRAGPERFAELVEREGINPAPYFARIFWVSADRWDVLLNGEWEDELRAAHALQLAHLPPRTHKFLSLPKAELKRIVSERRKLLATKAAAKKLAKGKQA